MTKYADTITTVGDWQEPTTDDRGAGALDREHAKWCENIAVAEQILGEHGRFLPDGIDPVGDALDMLSLQLATAEAEVKRLRAALDEGIALVARGDLYIEAEQGDDGFVRAYRWPKVGSWHRLLGWRARAVSDSSLPSSTRQNARRPMPPDQDPDAAATSSSGGGGSSGTSSRSRISRGRRHDLLARRWQPRLHRRPLDAECHRVLGR